MLHDLCTLEPCSDPTTQPVANLIWLQWNDCYDVMRPRQAAMGRGTLGLDRDLSIPEGGGDCGCGGGDSTLGGGGDSTLGGGGDSTLGGGGDSTLGGGGDATLGGGGDSTFGGGGDATMGGGRTDKQIRGQLRMREATATAASELTHLSSAADTCSALTGRRGGRRGHHRGRWRGRHWRHNCTANQCELSRMQGATQCLGTPVEGL